MRREKHLSKKWVSKGLELVGLEQEPKCGVWWLGLTSSFYDITTMSPDVLIVCLFVPGPAFLHFLLSLSLSFLFPFFLLL